MKAVFFSSLCYLSIYFLIIYYGYASTITIAITMAMPFFSQQCQEGFYGCTGAAIEVRFPTGLGGSVNSH